MAILDDNTYKNPIVDAGIPEGRARLYEAQLDYAKGKLDGMAANAAWKASALAAGRFGWKARLKSDREGREPALTMDYNVFARALSGDKLVKLMVELAKQLDPWMAYAIFTIRTDARLAAAPTAQQTNVRNAADYNALIAAVQALPKTATIHDVPNAYSKSVAVITYNFCNNLRLCCERLFERWDDLNEAFAPYMPWMGNLEGEEKKRYPIFEHVERFIPTGSDYHKGGRQVVLVDMALVLGSVGPSNVTNKDLGGDFAAQVARMGDDNINTLAEDEYGIERIVYKPGDVELDCRMVGNSEVINHIQPSGYKHEGPADKSMSEKINAFLGSPTARSLPTYVILPYSPGSKLARNWGAAGAPVIDIRQSYGFIQFLTHKPDTKDDLGKTANPSLTDLKSGVTGYDKPGWLAESDWIAPDGGNPEVDYFFIWGQLLAMCGTFSLSDMHSQNTIVHRHPYPRDSAVYPPAGSTPKPHLIDMEDGFKWPMQSLAMTGIFVSNLNKTELGESRLAVKGENSVDINGEYMPSPAEMEKNQCFFYDAAGSLVRRARATAASKRAMCEGLLAVLEAFRDDTKNGQIVGWVDELSNTVARFVPVETKQFYLNLRAYADDKDPLDARKRKRVGSTRTHWQSLAHQTKELVQRAWSVSHPFFAIEHDEHGIYDLENRDIPFFVHEMGHAELLNSRGWKIDVGAVHTWQNNNIAGLKSIADDDTGRRTDVNAKVKVSGLTQYFPSPAITFVKDQVEKLKGANDDAFFEKAIRWLKEILKVTAKSPMAGEEDPGDETIHQIVLNGTVSGVALRTGGYVYDFDDSRAKTWIIRDGGGEVYCERADFLFDEFMKRVKAANPKFTQKRSSLNDLIVQLEKKEANDSAKVEAEIKKIPTDRREKYGDAIQYLWDRYPGLYDKPKWPESQYKEFMNRVRQANHSFTQKRSSLNDLIKAINRHESGANIKAEHDKIAAGRRTKYNIALQHLKNTYPGYPA
jgi:hypothetical protein